MLRILSFAFGCFITIQCAAQTPDLQEIRDQVAAVSAVGGGTIQLTPGRTYDLGSKGVILDSGNLTFEGNGAVLLYRSEVAKIGNVFWSNSPDNLTFRNITFRDANQDLRFINRGVNAITLWPPVSLGRNCANVVVENCQCDGVTTLLKVRSSDTFRTRGIWVKNCTVRGSYYACAFEGSGDDVRVSGLICRRVVRPMIAYGVSNHHWELTVDSDGVLQEQKTLCLVKRYDRDTTGISIDITATGFHNGAEQLVCCEFQGGPGMSGTISDVAVNARFLCDRSAIKALAFASLENRPDGSYFLQTTTLNKWVRIRLDGNLAVGAPAIGYGVLDAASQPYVDDRTDIR